MCQNDLSKQKKTEGVHQLSTYLYVPEAEITLEQIVNWGGTTYQREEREERLVCGEIQEEAQVLLNYADTCLLLQSFCFKPVVCVWFGAFETVLCEGN
ncbi:hypothetical protein V6N11_062062 [Hibiscus sabdariffa]|uniref:Uncharacterized protein n=1 Tax=Hibiscus sabdariffa TaxID=183260 RepID=A0ABR2PRV4_9ROSI